MLHDRHEVCASGLVVKSNIPIVGPRVRFPAGAVFGIVLLLGVSFCPNVLLMTLHCEEVLFPLPMDGTCILCFAQYDPFNGSNFLSFGKGSQFLSVFPNMGKCSIGHQSNCAYYLMRKLTLGSDQAFKGTVVS